MANSEKDCPNDPELVPFTRLSKLNGISKERLTREVNQRGLDVHVENGQVSIPDAIQILKLISDLRNKNPK